jgi:threonyl-tRNA synthetase
MHPQPQPIAAAAAPIPLPTSAESDALLRIRHSCAHILAMAMQRVHRGARVTIGPAIERGFYYDFDMAAADEGPFLEAKLGKVAKEMRRIIRKDLPFVREEVTAEEARERIEGTGEPYKLEILDSILQRCAARSVLCAVARGALVRRQEGRVT